MAAKKKQSDEALLLDRKSPRELRKLLVEERRRLQRQKREQLKSAGAECKAARAELVKRQKARRKAAVLAWKKKVAHHRQCLQNRCKERQDIIRRTYAEGTERTKRLAAEIAAELKERRDMMKRTPTVAQIRAAHRRHEKLGETIEEARREVEATAPRMLPYFDQVVRKLRKAPNMSLAETFMLDAHQHPEEVVMASQLAADREVHALIAEEEARWKERHESATERVCRRATAHANSAKSRQQPFVLSDAERSALEKLGVRPGPLLAKCASMARRRIVSERTQRAPF